MHNTIKVAWIGFAGVVTAGVIVAVVTLLANKGKKADDRQGNNITIQTTEGTHSPAISNVNGPVTSGNENNAVKPANSE
ncbi:hypothetical protein MNBD_GAMMA11-3037 [hydrothermal vent metagenome]|uniref:Uncharacterized protein n=1 Tax=hydrothermal vent metagenome TaxID=652676 RepID=A0A3B0XIA2_9ZZZZ